MIRASLIFGISTLLCHHALAEPDTVEEKQNPETIEAYLDDSSDRITVTQTDETIDPQPTPIEPTDALEEVTLADVSAVTTGTPLVTAVSVKEVDQEESPDTKSKETGIESSEHEAVLSSVSIKSPTCGQSCRGICQERYLSPFAQLDFLYWRTRRDGLDLAINDSDSDNNIEGPLESLSLDAASGFRFTIGSRIACNWDLGFAYSHFDSEDQRSITTESGQLWLTRSNPASFNNSAASVSASADLRYRLFDLQAGYWTHPCDVASFRFFAGPRGSQIDQSLDIAYSGGTITGTRYQRQRTRMNGFGLRAGGEGHWRLGSALSVFGSASGSVLVGNLTVDYSEQEAALSSGNVATSIDSFETIPVGEIAAGFQLGWRDVTLRAGYELSSWMNVDQRVNFTGASSIMRGGYTPTSEDLILDGIFLRIGYAF